MCGNAELIWAAGLFAGEGCATIEKGPSKRPGPPYPILTLGMKDERSVRRFAAAFEGLLPIRSGPWKSKGAAIRVSGPDKVQMFRMHIGGTRAIAAFVLLLPFLIGTDKGDQVSDVLDLYSEGRS